MASQETYYDNEPGAAYWWAYAILEGVVADNPSASGFVVGLLANDGAVIQELTVVWGQVPGSATDRMWSFLRDAPTTCQKVRVSFYKATSRFEREALV